MNLRWIRAGATASAVLLAYRVAAEEAGNTSGDIAFQQANALFHFYVSTRMFSFRARRWHNWFRSGLPAEQYCNFSGVVCDADGYVQELTLRATGLRGTLALTNLTRLQVLQLPANTIHGRLPAAADLTALPALRVLNLGGNAFSGTIPDLSPLPQLERVLLYENFLTGAIPASLCNATGLTDLQLSGNARMRGTLPACLAGLSQLTSLKVTNAGLTGTIPTALCRLSRLNPDTSSCDAIGCAAGYYRVYQTSQSNGTLCEACPIPSNAVASTSCLWLGTETPAPTAAAPPAPAPVPSVQPTAVEALTSSAAPTRTMNLTLSPTASPVAVSNAKSPRDARKRSTAIAAIVAFGFIVALFVLILVTGAKHRTHCQDKVELDSDVEETSLGDPFVAYEIITVTPAAGPGAASPARNAPDLRSPTSLPFIRPRRRPRRKHAGSPPPGAGSVTSRPPKALAADVVRTPSPERAEKSTTDPSHSPTASAPTSPISPKSIAFESPVAMRSRSSLKQPESIKRPIRAIGDAGTALKQVRFSETGDKIVTFSYDATSEGDNSSNVDKTWAPIRDSFFWNQTKVDSVLEKHSLSGHSSPDQEDADTFSNSNDSIYDVKRQVVQPRSCPVVLGFLSCSGSDTVGLNLKPGNANEDEDDDSSECFPCHRSSKPLFRDEKSFSSPRIFQDDTRSGSPSSATSNSSEDDILTSLGVIHEDHASDDDNYRLGSGPVKGRTELVRAARLVRSPQRALMDDEASKESTLFSGDNGNEKFVAGPDQAEI